MQNERDIKLRELFQKYISMITDIIEECDDDEMYFALMGRILKHEAEEIYGQLWEENHKKGM